MKSMNLYDLSFPAVRGTVFEEPFSLLDRFFTDDPFPGGRFRAPAVDVRELNGTYVIEAELPGLTEKDVRLEIADGVLTLSTTAGTGKQKESPESRWIRRERRSYSFSRCFALPEEIDRDSVNASFRDGLLTVTLSRKPESAPRVVPVNAGSGS